MSGPTNPTEAYFDKGLWGHDGTQWRRLNLLWGFYDRWSESKSGTAGASGYWLVGTAVVPAGYVYVLQAAALLCMNRATTSASISVTDGTVEVPVSASAALAANTFLFFAGEAVLKADDRLYFYLNGTANGDTIVSVAWGYKMRINLG